MRRRPAFAVLLAAIALPACDRRSGSDSAAQPEAESAVAQTPPTRLTDLSTSLAAVRETFNAHRGEPRFLTLLAPT